LRLSPTIVSGSLQERCGPGTIATSPRSSLIKHGSDQVDFAALQFLRCAVGNFAVHPYRESFDVFLALRERSEFRDTSGCMLAPDRVIAGQRKNQRSVGVERADSMALHTDRTELRFRSVVTCEHLREAFEENRVLFCQ